MSPDSGPSLCLFVDGIAVIDSAVACADRGLYGATWLVDLELRGEADEPGMVLDFGLLKPRVKALVDEVFDHVLLVPVDLPGLDQRREAPRSGHEQRRDDPHAGLAEDPDGRILELNWSDCRGGRYRHLSPVEACRFVPGAAVTADGLAELIAEALCSEFGVPSAALRIVVREESIAGAAYSYCHGLEHHAGRCQRIAHGHRSQIEIRVDGERDPVLETEWAARWRDIYIGSRVHLRAPVDAACRFGYTAREGRFELDLPATRCELIDTESTVENIARFIAAWASDRRPGARVRVRAFEGVGKGGIAEVA